MSHPQVLLLLPEAPGSITQRLYNPKDIKVEVMCAQGAGGQVRIYHTNCRFPFDADIVLHTTAHEQNGICSTTDTYPDRDFCLDAR